MDPKTLTLLFTYPHFVKMSAVDGELGTSVTHPYTCLSCSLAFTNATFQRDHYGTDLHRYNSKRRVAGLMPISVELFDEKVSDRRVIEEEDPGRLSCKACKWVSLRRLLR